MSIFEGFVPTPDELIRSKIELAELHPEEVVFDLGCGDGRVLIHAAVDYPVRCVGIEACPQLFQQAAAAVSEQGLNDRVELRCEDFLLSDVSTADVVLLYLNRGTLGMLSRKLETELRPGTRVLTHTFDIPAWTESVRHEIRVDGGTLDTVFLYVV